MPTLPIFGAHSRSWICLNWRRIILFSGALFAYNETVTLLPPLFLFLVCVGEEELQVDPASCFRTWSLHPCLSSTSYCKRTKMRLKCLNKMCTYYEISCSSGNVLVLCPLPVYYLRRLDIFI